MLTFIDLFSGIGGFRLGMEQARHTCLGHCEIDKFAEKSYRAMHEVKEGEWYAADITKVRAEEIPKADCWCFGFPCTNISIAGKQAGIRGNQSGLFFDVIRLLEETKKENRPKWLFIENVKNLLSINKGFDFAGVLLHWMKSGMTQNGKCLTAPSSMYLSIEKGYTLSDILEEEVEEKYFLSKEKINLPESNK